MRGLVTADDTIMFPISGRVYSICFPDSVLDSETWVAPFTVRHQMSFPHGVIAVVVIYHAGTMSDARGNVGVDTPRFASRRLAWVR